MTAGQRSALAPHGTPARPRAGSSTPARPSRSRAQRAPRGAAIGGGVTGGGATGDRDALRRSARAPRPSFLDFGFEISRALHQGRVEHAVVGLRRELADLSLLITQRQERSL